MRNEDRLCKLDRRYGKQDWSPQVTCLKEVESDCEYTSITRYAAAPEPLRVWDVEYLTEVLEAIKHLSEEKEMVPQPPERRPQLIKKSKMDTRPSVQCRKEQ